MRKASKPLLAKLVGTLTVGLFLTACGQGNEVGFGIEANGTPDRASVTEKGKWEEERDDIRDENKQLAGHIHQVLLTGENAERLLLGTHHGLWEVNLTDIDLGEKVLGEETMVVGTRVEGAREDPSNNIGTGADWDIMGLAGFKNPDQEGTLLFSSGHPSEAEAKNGSPNNLGLLFSDNGGLIWREIGGVAGQVDFHSLAVGAVNVDTEGNQVSNTQWGVLGVDSGTGALLSGVVDTKDGDLTPKWLQGPQGAYTSVAIVDGIMFALDAGSGLMQISENTGQTWVAVPVPGYKYIFPVWETPGITGELYFISEDGELFYLPKVEEEETENSEPRSLVEVLEFAGKFPSGSIASEEISANGIKDRITVMLGERVYLSGDKGRTFNPLGFQLQVPTGD